MVTSSAKTVDDYLAALPEDCRNAVAAVRRVIRENLPAGYEECMQWGMIAYCVPLSVYPDTYNGAPLHYAAVAAQKNHLAVYLSGIYADEKLRQWFESEYRKTGKRMDIGKSCVRFRTLDDLPLALIGEAIGRVPLTAFIALYEAARASSKSHRKSRVRSD